MGCGGSKEDGMVLKLDVGNAQLVQSQTSPDLQKRQGGFDAFNAMEEEDEKALQISDTLVSKVAQGMGVVLPEGRTSFVAVEEEGSFEDQMNQFRAIHANMPLEEPGSASGVTSGAKLFSDHAEAWSRWRKLDEKQLAPTAASDLLESLLVPECPALPKRIVFRILLDACERLSKGDPVVMVPPPFRPNERQVIVGDTHGQLQDVLHILLTHGAPSATNRYIFNGDVADRGPNAVEIFMLILLFQQVNPDSTWLMRGNHEARDINERPAAAGGGFRDEVLAKYDENTYELFQLMFLQLPVAAVVGTQIFVIHGGLSREREKPLDALKALDHHCNIPQRPYGREECIIFDSLWADPQEEEGIHVGGRGDDTIKWGPDVTAQFLQETGLELIVRSHQVPAGRRGFGLHHNSKVITVFSASNYGGVCMNRGGVLIVPASGSVAIEEHMALTLEELRKAHRMEKLQRKRTSKAPLNAAEAKMLLGWRARAHEHASERRTRDLKAELHARVDMEDDEQDAAQERLIDNLLGSVRARICEHQPRLRAALVARHSDLCRQGMATEDGGLVALTMWRDVLDNVLGLRLDWSTMPDRFQEGLAAVVHEPRSAESTSELDESLYPAVKFKAFLGRFHVAVGDEPLSPLGDSSSSSSAAARSKLSAHLLAIVHSQSLALRKALVLSSTSGGEQSPGPSSRLTSSRPHSSRNAIATVGLSDFLSAIETLAGAVEQGHTFTHADFAAVAAVVPTESQSDRLYFHRFLDSLRVVDSLAPAYA